jgi:hypothetical protein
MCTLGLAFLELGVLQRDGLGYPPKLVSGQQLGLIRVIKNLDWIDDPPSGSWRLYIYIIYIFKYIQYAWRNWTNILHDGVCFNTEFGNFGHPIADTIGPYCTAMGGKTSPLVAELAS